MILNGDLVQLRLLSPQEMLAWVNSLEPAVRKEISPDWLNQLLQAEGPDPWRCGFAISDLATSTSVGTCAFKSPPKDDGSVEIAYGIEDEHRCKGYATDAARVMVKFAREQDLKSIIAHAKPENPASERMLSKAGFTCLGIHDDPEDGLVNRWEQQLTPSA